MKRALVLSVALVGLATGCGAGGHADSLPPHTVTKPGGAAHPASLPGLTATKLAKIEKFVKRNAIANGDAHPSSAFVFASRRHEANIAAGAGTGVFGTQPVYLVVIHGHFVCNLCSGPPGHAAPRGDVITYVLDRKNLGGLDFGIGHHVDMSRLGSGVSLSLS